MQTWLLHNTEDNFKAVGGGAKGDGEGFVELILLEAAVKGIRDVGEVYRLACSELGIHRSDMRYRMIPEGLETWKLDTF